MTIAKEHTAEAVDLNLSNCHPGWEVISTSLLAPSGPQPNLGTTFHPYWGFSCTV